MVFFDQNTLAGDWRAQVRYCRENGIALYRDIAFAAAVADLLDLPDDLPLMPAVTAAIFVPSLPQRSGKSRSPESSSPRSWNVTTIRRRRLIASVLYSPSWN